MEGARKKMDGAWGDSRTVDDARPRSIRSTNADAFVRSRDGSGMGLDFSGIGPRASSLVVVVVVVVNVVARAPRFVAEIVFDRAPSSIAVVVVVVVVVSSLEGIRARTSLGGIGQNKQ